MPAGPTERNVERELLAAHERLKAATQRAAVADNPAARPATRVRAAAEAKEALALLMNAAQRHVGTPQEKQWWALHRAASELRATVARRSEKLSSSKSTPSPRKSSRKVSATAKKGKKRKKRGSTLPPLDTSPEARRKRNEVSKRRYAALQHGPIKEVSAGLPGLGKRR